MSNSDYLKDMATIVSAVEKESKYQNFEQAPVLLTSCMEHPDEPGFRNYSLLFDIGEPGKCLFVSAFIDANDPTDITLDEIASFSLKNAIQYMMSYFGIIKVESLHNKNL